MRQHGRRRPWLPGAARAGRALMFAGCVVTGATRADEPSTAPAAPPAATATESADGIAATRKPDATAVWPESLRRAAEALEWSDETIRHDWRIQRRPGTDQCRVVDPRERVVATGSGDTCRARFHELAAAGTIPPHHGPTVVVLHGLGEGRSSMRPLVDYLRQRLDATVVAFGYASPRAGLADHGAALARVVAGLPAGEPVSFVGHSLGNLVVRRWMHSAPPDELARVRRMVMLGAPNQGSDLARMMSRWWVLTALSDGAARELVVDWKRVAPELAIPPCPFGIVAGGRGDDQGFSPLLDGDDDAIVRVEETRLDGADDFLLVPVHHAAMMHHPTIQRATAAFLESGRFAVEAQKPAEPAAP